ncbi:zinc finger domain-containing protein [Mycobacteroides salmoniphilum]
MYVCQDCGVPEGQPCRWIAKDGVGIAGSTRHFPHESRWRR